MRSLQRAMISRSFVDLGGRPGKLGKLSGHAPGRGAHRHRLAGWCDRVHGCESNARGTSSTTDAHFPADGFLSFAIADATRSA